jgi:tRNA nucleotidyltransferase (CCA-adding enzyme)
VRTDGRHAEVEFGVSLDDDLARRDFTINAIAYHPLTHEWRDPFDGARDLDAKLLRAVGDPNARFREDYLRILRLLRFASRFGFEIDPPTWEAAKVNAEGLHGLSAERVREEWMRGLSGARSARQLVQFWCEIGAMATWLPEVRCALNADPAAAPSPASPDVQLSAHSAQRTALTRFEPRDPILMTAYLSRDPAATLSRLRCSNAEIERGRAVGEHRGSLPNPEEPVEVRRWMAAVGDAVDDLVAIARAEGKGARLAAAVEAVRASSAPLTIADLAIGGKELMDAGVPEGPRIGETLRHLLDRVLEDPALNTKDDLLRLAADGLSSAHSAQRTADSSAHGAQRTRERRGKGK